LVCIHPVFSQRNLFFLALCALILLAAATPAGRAQASSHPDEEYNLVAPPGAAEAAPSQVRPAELAPPLPFTAPLIGPVIKRGFVDDVDRWTTAFIPRNLDHLTPIEMPDTDERWIRVDLSEQTVVAYEGARPIRGFIISSGLPRTPTVTGSFRIRAKVRSQTMTGGDPALGNYYNLANVQWVQYFFADYGFHGTYWHQKFGQPMSHGCINMTNADAKWLFDWAGPKWDGKSIWYASTADNPGTLVIVHE
jgi:lipoprotein-anchoring transpeptidase ErfK/SrfK